MKGSSPDSREPSSTRLSVADHARDGFVDAPGQTAVETPEQRRAAALVTPAEDGDLAPALVQGAGEAFDDRRLARAADGEVAHAEHEAAERAGCAGNASGRARAAPGRSGGTPARAPAGTRATVPRACRSDAPGSRRWRTAPGSLPSGASGEGSRQMADGRSPEAEGGLQKDRSRIPSASSCCLLPAACCLHPFFRVPRLSAVVTTVRASGCPHASRIASATASGDSSVRQQIVEPEPLRKPTERPRRPSGREHVGEKRDQRQAVRLVERPVLKRVPATPRNAARRTPP